jgi:hypothetical protein
MLSSEPVQHEPRKHGYHNEIGNLVNVVPVHASHIMMAYVDSMLLLVR